MSDRPLVFDAEPLVAHADEEVGAGRVAELLDVVKREQRDGYVSQMTLAEVRYVLARSNDRVTADKYLDWLETTNIEPVSTDDLWRTVADYVLRYNPALGDAVALATASEVGGTLVVGGDDDYDEVGSVPIERFRAGSG
jgi:predicted nucleic acid-binding protein